MPKAVNNRGASAGPAPGKLSNRKLSALKLHQEELVVYEALGEKRSRTVTLGQIARSWPPKGEVDRALKLHQESLAIYEALGEKRSRAITLGDIAELLAAKGEVDQALKLHQEKLVR